MPLIFDARSSFDDCLLLLQKAVSKKARNHSWMGEVRNIIADLEALNQSTEADFLAIGGNLMNLLTTSRRLHSELEALTALSAGEHVREACHALVSVRSYVGDVERRSEADREAFLTLQESARRIHRGFSALGQIATSFHVTAILARIEAAHLSVSRNDMANLADQVQTCSDGIETHANQVLQAAALFNVRLEAALCEAANYEVTQKKELLLLLQAIETDLQSLEAQQQLAITASARLRTELKSIGQDLEAVGTSVQSHDITRQQIEHVIEALREVERGAPRRALAPPAAILLRVQRAQLASATESFRRSVEKIDSDLRSVAGRVGQMSSAASPESVTGDTGEGRFSFEAMQGRMVEVLHKVRALSSSQRAARATVVEVQQVSQELRGAVKEMHAIELQLSRISINGIIASCEIGHSGEPLSVVAEAMQTLQIECTDRSRAATGEIESIDRTVALLGAGEQASASGAEEAVLANLQASNKNLSEATIASCALSNTIAELADALQTELQQVRVHAGIGKIFAETANRCGSLLDTLAAGACPLWSSGAPAPPDQQADRYTMQTERDIQNAILSGQEPLAADPALSTSDAPVNQFEEVEFF